MRVKRAMFFEPAGEPPEYSANVDKVGIDELVVGPHGLVLIYPEGQDDVLVPWANIRHIVVEGKYHNRLPVPVEQAKKEKKKTLYAAA